MIAFGALAAVLVVAGGPQWSAPGQISSSARALAPELALSSTGDALVVWDQEVGADCPTTPASLSCIHIVTAVERPSLTSTWAAPIELNRPGVGSRPRPAVDANGDAAVIWVHDIGVDRVLQATYRRGPGGQWPQPNDLSDYVLGVADHDVGLDADGTAYISWTERTDSGAVARYQRRPASSGVWSGAGTLSNRVIGGPALTITASRAAEMAWLEPEHLAYGSIPYTGAGTVEPATGTLPTGTPDIATTAGDRAFVFPATGSSGAVVEGVLCCSVSNRATTAQIIGAGTRPQVAMNGTATVAVWLGPSGVQAADGSVTSGTWTAPVTLARDPSATDPQIAVDPSGNGVAVWLSGSGNVQAAIRPAATRVWQSAVTLSGAGASAPRVAMDGAGNALAVWNRTSGESVAVENSELSATGPVIEQVVVPKHPRVRRRVVFSVHVAPWASPLSGLPVWRFGDGKSATGLRVTHTYTRSGRYTVTVTQHDATGGVATAKATIKVATRAHRS